MAGYCCVEDHSRTCGDGANSLHAAVRAHHREQERTSLCGTASPPYASCSIRLCQGQRGARVRRLLTSIAAVLAVTLLAAACGSSARHSPMPARHLRFATSRTPPQPAEPSFATQTPPPIPMPSRSRHRLTSSDSRCCRFWRGEPDGKRRDLPSVDPGRLAHDPQRCRGQDCDPDPEGPRPLKTSAYTKPIRAGPISSPTRRARPTPRFASPIRSGCVRVAAMSPPSLTQTATTSPVTRRRCPTIRGLLLRR